ncbi:DNA utilization protein GntX [Rouxiella sp. Mn2063]|uniref:DNA utilization protein GntX n=1 Tax=Rouxiella sp. Mn2063 TaxID=3395262 RepID=UPI003BE1AAA6
MLTIASRCWLCQQPLQLAQTGFCSLCLKNLPALPICCPRCGLPSASSLMSCGRCLNQPPPWQTMVFASDYNGPIGRLVQRMKFSSLPELATPLSRLLLLRWLTRFRQGCVNRPDVLLSVPLHIQRYRQRGYNQSELLALPLARWLQCDYSANALRRHRSTPPQLGLGEKQRKRNLRHAFSVDENLSGLHIALLDDVITTGSTLREITKVLLNQPIASIQVFSICRTL